MLRLVTRTPQQVGGDAYNVFHFGGSAPADAAAASAALKTFWDSTATVRQNGTTTAFDGLITVLDEDTGLPIATLNVAPWNSAGTWGSGRSPAGLALCIRWRTGIYVGAREIRGRTFMAGLGDINEGSTIVPAAIVTAMNTHATTLENTGLLVVFSPKNLTAPTVTSASCWDRFAFLKTRRA